MCVLLSRDLGVDSADIRVQRSVGKPVLRSGLLLDRMLLKDLRFPTGGASREAALMP